MVKDTPSEPQYDLPTAVTFLLAGLVLGAILTVLFSPLDEASEARPSRTRSYKPAVGQD